jgi:hypothetical protein
MDSRTKYFTAQMYLLCRLGWIVLLCGLCLGIPSYAQEDEEEPECRVIKIEVKKTDTAFRNFPAQGNIPSGDNSLGYRSGQNGGARWVCLRFEVTVTVEGDPQHCQVVQEVKATGTVQGVQSFFKPATPKAVDPAHKVGYNATDYAPDGPPTGAIEGQPVIQRTGNTIKYIDMPRMMWVTDAILPAKFKARFKVTATSSDGTSKSLYFFVIFTLHPGGGLSYTDDLDKETD